MCAQGCRGCGPAGLAQGGEEPEASSWWDYLQSKGLEFLDLTGGVDRTGPQVLYDLAHDAAGAAAAARARGDLVGYQEGRLAVERIMSLWRKADSLRGPVLHALEITGMAGMGALVGPWVYVGLSAAAVVATGAAVAWVLARYGAEAQVVELLRRGELTPDAAATLLEAAGSAPGGGILSSVATLAVLVGGFAVWKALK